MKANDILRVEENSHFDFRQDKSALIPLNTGGQRGDLTLLRKGDDDEPEWYLEVDTALDVKVNGVPLRKGDTARCVAAGDAIFIAEKCCYLFNEYRLPNGAPGALLLPYNSAKKHGISAENVKAKYGEKEVLKGVDLTVEPGKLTAIAGLSGCGKSTLLKILFGDKAQSAGTVEYPGSESENPVGVNEKRRTGFVPQFGVQLKELTVGQCLRFAAQLREPDKNYHGPMVSYALSVVGLADDEEQAVSDLSGGQEKRLDIAVELVGRPDILFLDEPTSGLDSETEKAIIEVLRKLTRRGFTVVFVTHSPLALADVDQLLVLRRGGTVGFSGTPSELKAEYERKENKQFAWENVYSWVEQSNQQREEALKNQQRYDDRQEGKGGISCMERFPLLNRYICCWQRSLTASLLTFIGLPLLIGLMIVIAQPIDHAHPKFRFLFAVIALFWIALNQSVREIVKEKDRFFRERRLRFCYVVSYYGSKCIFLTAVAFCQALLMLLIVQFLEVEKLSLLWNQSGLTESLRQPALLLVQLVLAGVVGTIIGLTVSSLSLYRKRDGEYFAVMASVLITFPQIIFSAATMVSQQLGAEQVGHQWAEWISYLTFSRYLYYPLEECVSVREAMTTWQYDLGLVVCIPVVVVITWAVLWLGLWKEEGGWQKLMQRRLGKSIAAVITKEKHS